MEVVVAMMIFTVMAGTVLGLLITTADTTGTNIRRTTAANLASRQIDSLRKLSPLEVKALPSTVTFAPITVGNIAYTVKQIVQPAENSSIASICVPPAGGATPAKQSFSRINVTVTWPGMGKTQPVKAETLLALVPAVLTPWTAQLQRSRSPARTVRSPTSRSTW